LRKAAANIYAEYPIRLGSTQLTLSVNVDNVTNSSAAQRLFPLYN
jgi:hypothetical protein